MGPVSRKSAVINAVWVGLLLLVVVPFALHAFERGAAVLGPDEQATSRLFHAGQPITTLSIYAHMVTGGLVTLLAPLQLVTSMRRRWPALHRALGRVVAVLAITTAIGGLGYIALHGTIGGPLMSAGFTLYGVLMLLSVVMTVRYAARRDPRHRLWAERLVILALASWLYRVHYGIWQIVTGGVASRPDFSGLFDQVQVFAFYLPYLLIHTLIWQSRHSAQQHLA
ncbi:MAG: DUF2306 domain-containing protein [Roseobacter sp.]